MKASSVLIMILEINRNKKKILDLEIVSGIKKSELKLCKKEYSKMFLMFL